MANEKMSHPVTEGEKHLTEWHAKAPRCHEEKPKDKRHYFLWVSAKSRFEGFESRSGVIDVSALIVSLWGSLRLSI